MPATEEPTTSDLFGVAGLVGWITGASRGLGRQIAQDLASAGATLMVTARDAHAIEELAAAIRHQGGSAIAVPGSVTDRGHLEEVISQAHASFGRLDFLVNNAGVSPVYERAQRVDETTWSHIMDINLSAPFAAARAAHPLLQASKHASIVNISSIHGSVAHERIAAYATSKGGLELLTRSLAVDWARDGIRVNSVAPGYVATDMTRDLRRHEQASLRLLDRIPMGRFAEPWEIAPSVHFLVSRAASYITGCTLTVDGGWTAG